MSVRVYVPNELQLIFSVWNKDNKTIDQIKSERMSKWYVIQREWSASKPPVSTTCCHTRCVYVYCVYYSCPCNCDLRPTLHLNFISTTDLWLRHESREMNEEKNIFSNSSPAKIIALHSILRSEPIHSIDAVSLYSLCLHIVYKYICVWRRRCVCVCVCVPIVYHYSMRHEIYNFCVVRRAPVYFPNVFTHDLIIKNVAAGLEHTCACMARICMRCMSVSAYGPTANCGDCVNGENWKVHDDVDTLIDAMTSDWVYHKTQSRIEMVRLWCRYGWRGI